MSHTRCPRASRSRALGWNGEQRGQSAVMEHQSQAQSIQRGRKEPSLQWSVLSFITHPMPPVCQALQILLTGPHSEQQGRYCVLHIPILQMGTLRHERLHHKYSGNWPQSPMYMQPSTTLPFSHLDSFGPKVFAHGPAGNNLEGFQMGW
jgi:hypothetical protein